MRQGSIRRAVMAGTLLALIPTVAPAAVGPASARNTTAEFVVATGSAGQESVSTVTLPTGEMLQVSGAPGRERIGVLPIATSGPGRSLITQRSGTSSYVFPVTAQPYLGRFLDPELFDVTRLVTLARTDDRQPLRISFRGVEVATPGVTVSTTSAKAASGYVTSSSAADFGQALAQQWRADQRTGRSDRTSLFPGVLRISAAGSISTALSRSAAAEATFPLVIKVIGADGAPTAQGSLTLMNVDDGRKLHVTPAVDSSGEARVAVPKGTYSALSQVWDYDPQNDRLNWTVTAVNEFKITTAGGTMTIDHRTATVSPAGISVPKPAARRSYSVNWVRSDAQAEPYVMSSDLTVYDEEVLLSPSAAAGIGAVSVIQSWSLQEPVKVPTYTYSLATKHPSFPAEPAPRFRAADLAAITSSYYGEGRGGSSVVFRYPEFAGRGGDGSYSSVPRGTRRTEYVGALGGNAVWSETVIVNEGDRYDGGYLFAANRSIAAGSTASVNWMKGPLAPAVSRPGDGGCVLCRSGNDFRIWLPRFADSDLSHEGTFGSFESDDVSESRFRLYRSGKLISDEKNNTGDLLIVPPEKANYKAIIDVDRRSTSPAQATRTKTELSFTSTRNAGKPLPASMNPCDLGAVCRVPTAVQARLSLPLKLDGTLPAGKSTVSVTVASIQYAAASVAKSATLEIRPPGKAWTTVKLKAIGGGKYQGTLDSSKLAGLNVDVRFTGANKAGSAFRQTVLKAYTVAAN